jgi:hypothetical protein
MANDEVAPPTVVDYVIMGVKVRTFVVWSILSPRGMAHFVFEP